MMGLADRIRMVWLVLLAAVGVGAVSGVASASAAEPWWGLTSATRPTVLKPGGASDEVQEVAVKAASGTYTLTVVTGTGYATSTTGSNVLQEVITTGGSLHLGDTVRVIGFSSSVPANTTITGLGAGTITMSANGTGPGIDKKFPTPNNLSVSETTGAINGKASAAEVRAALEALPGIGVGNAEVTGADGGPYQVTLKGPLAYQPVALMQANGSAQASVSELTRGRADGEIAIFAQNLGDATADGESAPVRVADVLPAGLEAVAIAASESAPEGNFGFAPPEPCSLAGLSCTSEATIAPYDQMEVRIAVRVRPGASASELNFAQVGGGGAPTKSLRRPVQVGEQASPFGVQEWTLGAEEEDGAPVTQAGSHPFQVTGTVVLDQGPDRGLFSDEPRPLVEAVALPKDIVTKIPAGLIGNPVPLPRCTMHEFITMQFGQQDECPQQDAIGVATVSVYEPRTIGYFTQAVPLFNLEPYYGEPARFGFAIPAGGVPVVLDTSLRDGPGEDYGINVTSSNISEIAGLTSVSVTFWGVPDDHRHDNSRGWECLLATRGASGGVEGQSCEANTDKTPPGFLTMPTSCQGSMQSSAEADPWKEPGVYSSVGTSEPLQELDGCNRLPFAPLMSAEPTTDRASAPSGLDFNLDFKDEGLTSSEGLAQSQLNKTVVKLPEGLTINPSAGVGLGGCTPEDYARETVDSQPGEGCPNDSKLGTVEIETPLLTQKIQGSIYIAQPYDNPSDSLVALYVVAKNPEVGVLVKLTGKVEPNPITGQLTTVFENNPQLAFSHFNFHFREGQQAPLVSPATCGTYSTQALLTPWSEPTETLTDTASFSITKGYDGGACPSGGVPPFKPGIEAGLINNNAGAFSSFYLHLTRTDAEQEISGFSTNLPAGLTGDLSGVPFCPEADIEAARHKSGAQEEASPSCPAASEIGHSLVGTGVGAVLAYVPGKIYLAGPFHGAPFSIVSVTSAVVGPFDLGTVVLRFGLTIDPTTARVSVTPTGSEPIPTIIDGIVTHVRDIRVYISRPNFILDPTSCDPLSISSTLTSPAGASTTVTSPFQSASCQTLKFEPKFAVSTSGKTSRMQGASLHVKLTYPSGALGKDTDIAKVKVDLPRQLPSRLTTLQKACTETQFEANPAGCPAESKVGQAKAITPLIPVPLEGPAYFVSHGGAKFPELVIVLQGYGVTIDLHGETFINKEGITSSTFAAVPDQPIGSFELTLPEGKYSALAANGNLCAVTKTVLVKKKITVTSKGHKKTVTRNVKQVTASSLVMPTAFVAQNGTEIHQNTPITVTGCTKTTKAKKTKKTKKAKKARTDKRG